MVLSREYKQPRLSPVTILWIDPGTVSGVQPERDEPGRRRELGGGPCLELTVARSLRYCVRDFEQSVILIRFGSHSGEPSDKES